MGLPVASPVSASDQQGRSVVKYEKHISAGKSGHVNSDGNKIRGATVSAPFGRK